jgi:UDP-3-O-acyl-N-acetylglucosamine deacetylase
VGHLVVHKGGHSLHTQLVRNLLARPEAWTAVDLAPDTTPPWSEQEAPLPLAAALA